MARAGMIGGIAPASSIDYYKLIVEQYREAKGDGSFPRIIINSIDLMRMLSLVDDRPAFVNYLSSELDTLARAGVDFAFFASNTPHLAFDEIQARSALPLIGIVTTARAEAERLGLERVLVLGTRFTMQGGFYQKQFAEKEIEVITPTPEEQLFVHDRYMSELVNGVFKDTTRERFATIIQRIRNEQGIDGVILGGTELPLLLRGLDAGISVIDTTRLHVAEVVKRLL